ncbi:SET domain-containing protein, partial [Aureobasidium melanogenum]
MTSTSSVHTDIYQSIVMLPSPVSDVKIEKKKKRRAGKKEQLKRQCRQERECLENDMNSDDGEALNIAAFETRNAGAKGFGLFATRDIEPGERLIEESPLFILPKQDTLNAAIVESFMQLRSEQRAAYLKLSSYTTCTEKAQAEDVETSAAEDGATGSPVVVADSGYPVVQNELSAEQVDRCSCASDAQPPPSSFDIENGCKSPNPASSSGDQSLKGSDKLELSESGATTTVTPAQQATLDNRIWSVKDLEEALRRTVTDSGTRSGVNGTADDNQPDHDSDECEMSESLAARVVNIWRTNSYMLDDGITLDSAGVGLTTSRLNHSCVPNVYTAYNSTSGCMTVQALKPITAGDELCTAYINGAGKLRSERRAQLSMWGFTCTCIACADGRDESRRREIKTLMTKLEGVKTQMLEGDTSLSVAQIEQAVGDLLDQATLMSDEGLLGPDLADVCFGAARCCMLIGRHGEAGDLQSSGLGFLLRGYGIDNPICIATLQAGDLDEA